MGEPWRFSSGGLSVLAYEDENGMTRFEFRDGQGRAVPLTASDMHGLMLAFLDIGSIVNSIGKRSHEELQVPRPTPLVPEPVELVCGRFRGEPSVADWNPETDEVR